MDSDDDDFHSFSSSNHGSIVRSSRDRNTVLLPVDKPIEDTGDQDNSLLPTDNRPINQLSTDSKPTEKSLDQHQPSSPSGSQSVKGSADERHLVLWSKNQPDKIPHNEQRLALRPNVQPSRAPYDEHRLILRSNDQPEESFPDGHRLVLRSHNHLAVTADEDLYWPLPSKTHIRLLVLQEGQSSLLQATLKVVDLAEEPLYEAISYSWGIQRFIDIDKHIVINGHKIAIRDNLWTALQRMRLRSGPRVLWVDALSICQTDPEEKAQQVLLIGNIFKQAVRVLMWVGDHDRRSEELFKPWIEPVKEESQVVVKIEDHNRQSEQPLNSLVEQINQRTRDKTKPENEIAESSPAVEPKKEKTGMKRLWNKIKGDRSSIQKGKRSVLQKERTRSAARVEDRSSAPSAQIVDRVDSQIDKQSLSQMPSDNELYKTKERIWTAFLRRQYWTRRWIIQEILLAREIIVHCGDSEMNWDELIETRYTKADITSQGAHLGFLDGIEFLNTASDSPKLFFRLVALRKERVRSLSLMELMMTFKEAKCSDDRDKVYAFMALDSGKPVIQPSYHIGVEDLFLLMLSACIDRTLPSRPGVDNELWKICELWIAFDLDPDQQSAVLKMLSVHWPKGYEVWWPLFESFALGCLRSLTK